MCKSHVSWLSDSLLSVHVSPDRHKCYSRYWYISPLVLFFSGATSGHLPSAVHGNKIKCFTKNITWRITLISQKFIYGSHTNCFMVVSSNPQWLKNILLKCNGTHTHTNTDGNLLLCILIIHTCAVVTVHAQICLLLTCTCACYDMKFYLK